MLCAQSLRNASSLPFFTPRHRFEDPCADEEEVKFNPESGVLAFLETCASALGLALDREAKACALQKLRSTRLVESTSTAGDAPLARRKGTRDAGESVIRGGGGGDGSGGGGGGGEGVGSGVRKMDGTRVISSATDVYVAVTDALAQALVHCERFEVRKTTNFCVCFVCSGRVVPLFFSGCDSRWLSLKLKFCTSSHPPNIFR